MCIWLISFFVFSLQGDWHYIWHVKPKCDDADWYIHCYIQTIYNHNVFSAAIFIDLYDIMDLPNVSIVINGMN
jgi:hypothetical protein